MEQVWERSGVSVRAMSHSGVSVGKKRKESRCHVNRNIDKLADAKEVERTPKLPWVL